MGLPALDNLVRTGQLKAEPRNDAEIRRMLTMARTRLDDAGQAVVSVEGRFTSAYNAAHAAAVAALRWHGYRSESRYIVFQSLTHQHAFQYQAASLPGLRAVALRQRRRGRARPGEADTATAPEVSRFDCRCRG